MSTSKQLAKHLNEVYFGGNWTTVSLKSAIEDISWNQAVTKIQNFNTIAALVYHINYYVHEVASALQGNDLQAQDELSFNHPPIQSQADWDKMLDQCWVDARVFASLIEKISDAQLHDFFQAEKYGTYFRNLMGIIEHAHYHLGQIILIKKMLSTDSKN